MSEREREKERERENFKGDNHVTLSDDGILYSTGLPFCNHKNCILHSRRSDQPALHDANALVYTSRKRLRTRHLLNSHARQRYPEIMGCRTQECRMRGIRKQNVALTFILECICGWNTECRNYIECRMVPCTTARGNDGTIYSSGESNPG